LAGVLILGLIMVIHELGHFLAGLAFGFKIDQFSIFMGPVLFERERNGIRYNIKSIPLGASVSFAGESSEIEGQEGEHDYDADDPDLFENKPKWQRAIVIAMGPVLNFVTALIVFSLLFTATGAVVPVIGRVEPQSLIAETAIEKGDRIVSLNGVRITTPLDISITEMSHREDAPWVIGYVTPEGEKKTASVMPKKAPPRPMLGITYQDEDGRFIIVSVHEDADRGALGFMPQDEVLTINGISFAESERVTEEIMASEGKPLNCEIIRDGEKMSLEVSPFMLEADMPLGIVLTLSK
jgi:regulator of sigma E protease